MKFITIRETFLEPLQTVIGVVERKQTLPILANVLIQVSGNNLTITGTDLEVELIGQTQLEQAAIEDGSITVPGRKLVDICKALPDSAPLEFTVEKNQATIKSGSGKFTLSTLPAADFPANQELDTQVELDVAQGELQNLLKQTAFCMAQQDVRYYLNGMLIEVSNNLLKAVATDGHRLATSEIAISASLEHRLQVILPRKAILELARLLQDDEDRASIKIGNNICLIKTDRFTFSTKLVEGRFPDYQRVIPQSTDKMLLINREDFKATLMRVSILCNEKFRGVRLCLDGNAVTLQANNPEHETAEESIAIQSYSGEKMEIGFNVSYLLDVLNTIHTEDMVIRLTSANASILLTNNDEDPSSLFVIMPMRL